MKIKNIKIKGIASFHDFSSPSDFSKTTLIFGTNGSGKSTLARLLQLIDRNQSKQSDDTLFKLESYIQKKFSKDTLDLKGSLFIEFQNEDFGVEYDSSNNALSFHGSFWPSVKVFNDKYTDLTIGEVIDIDLPESGVIMGEPNRLLNAAQKKLNGLVTKQSNVEISVRGIIESALQEYSRVANSRADVSDTISKDAFIADSCSYSNSIESINTRRALGYETPEDNLSLLNFNKFSNIIDSNHFAALFNEVIEEPEIDEEKSELLLNFTSFYKDGVGAYNKIGGDYCPFCFQSWPNSRNVVKKYMNFLQSSYNQKRSQINSLHTHLEKVQDQIKSVNSQIRSLKGIVDKDGIKYSIDTSPYSELLVDPNIVSDIKNCIEKKLASMDVPNDISSFLKKFESSYTNSIKSANSVIIQIKDAIKKITSRRKEANKEVAKYIMKKTWTDNSKLRADFHQVAFDIQSTKNEITELEKRDINVDTICAVFNGLIDFLGLSEYQISGDKKLLLRLNKDYDISNEGTRISSSQRKLLSLCYFVAEAISEIKDVSQLKNYILVFDDPVDSADFIYFHGITALIENLEGILSKILKKHLKLGQVIVLTHNSLFYDRLCKTFEYKKSLSKIENVSVLQPANKTMNNYKIYLEYITRYYKNPKKNKKDMIFIGTIIRRVLEILSNFNDLGDNKFSTFVIDLGKPKLALLANHLSHESFSRVLNPFSSETELKEACRELLDVIEDSHPRQYEYILDNMLN